MNYFSIIANPILDFIAFVNDAQIYSLNINYVFLFRRYISLIISKKVIKLYNDLITDFSLYKLNKDELKNKISDVYDVIKKIKIHLLVKQKIL